MKKTEIWIFEIVLVVALVALGLSNRKILFIQGPRSMVIVLGIIGMLLCTLSIGKFISQAAFHPLTILGYILGVLLLLVFITQLFKLNIPYLKDPKIALIVLGLAIIAKGFIARFEDFL